ncbi:hypothetical protein KP79_PYT23557 [Mizuhopecten yessoensis]|uniref:Uncharacterized protein n=2 Tax=Mizuhopecten yessoensis TaxID=6573 RepID=A0A210PEQ1_MIZYE|nr:hypothetical protein KP79_PYT23557 [Mizuhopecten yessoensis]
MLFAIITIIRVRRTPNKTVYKVKAANSNTNTNREVTEYVNMYDVNFILKDAGTADTSGEANNGLVEDEISETNDSKGNEANIVDAESYEEHVTEPEVVDQEEVAGPDEYHGFDIDDVIGDDNENNDETLHEVD